MRSCNILQWWIPPQEAWVEEQPEPDQTNYAEDEEEPARRDDKLLLHLEEKKDGCWYW